MSVLSLDHSVVVGVYQSSGSLWSSVSKTEQNNGTEMMPGAMRMGEEKKEEEEEEGRSREKVQVQVQGSGSQRKEKKMGSQ